MGTPTANKGLTIPTLNGDFGVWGSELNGDLNILDLNLGGSQSIALSSTNVVATATQAQYLITAFTGALTANVSYTLPPAGGLFVFANKTTEPFSVTVACAGGGSSIVIPQGSTMPVVCDGINVTSAASAYVLNAPVGTVTTVNSLQLSGSLTAATGIISTGVDTGGLNFRATDASYGAGLLVNGSFAYLLGTSAGSPLAAFNAYRPLYWNLDTGAVAIDASAAGVTMGGALYTNGTIYSGSAITANGNLTGINLVLQKTGGVFGYDSAGTLRLISNIGADNYTNVFNAGGQGWRVLNQAGTQQLFFVDPVGHASLAGQLTTANFVTGNIEATGINSVYGFSSPTGYCEAAVFQGPDGTMNVNGALYCNSTAAFSGGVYCASSLGVTGPAACNDTLNVAAELFAASNIRSAVGYTCLNGPNSGGYGNIFNIWWTIAGAYLYIDSTAIAWQSVPSDRAYKQDIAPLAYGLEKLLQLTPVSYRFNGVNPLFSDDGKTRDGLIAQDVQEVLPSAVNEAINEDSPMSIELMPLVALLIKSVQELSGKLDAALNRITALEAAAA